MLCACAVPLLTKSCRIHKPLFYIRSHAGCLLKSVAVIDFHSVILYWKCTYRLQWNDVRSPPHRQLLRTSIHDVYAQREHRNTVTLGITQPKSKINGFLGLPEHVENFKFILTQHLKRTWDYVPTVQYMLASWVGRENIEKFSAHRIPLNFFHCVALHKIFLL